MVESLESSLNGRIGEDVGRRLRAVSVIYRYMQDYSEEKRYGPYPAMYASTVTPIIKQRIWKYH